MQPQMMRPWLREQLDSLVAKTREHGAANEKRLVDQNMRRAKLARQQTDYAMLIREWFDAMPPAVRNRRYLMVEFEGLFPGRYRDHASRTVIGPTLQRLGWTVHRDWTKAGRNRRYWCPPVG